MYYYICIYSQHCYFQQEKFGYDPEAGQLSMNPDAAFIDTSNRLPVSGRGGGGRFSPARNPLTSNTNGGRGRGRGGGRGGRIPGLLKGSGTGVTSPPPTTTTASGSPTRKDLADASRAATINRDKINNNI